jgi:phosphoesterase RecJ-like protein
MGKTVSVCCDGEMPHRYAELFVNQTLLSPAQVDRNCDLAIAVDCADKARLGKAAKVFDRAAHTVNIDHHVTNDHFAAINYIMDASSTGEIIFELMRLFNAVHDENTAKYLYIAMSTDTGNFTYSNTGRKCLLYVSELVELFDIRKVADVLFRRRTLVSTKLIARALSRLETFEDGKIAFVTVFESDLKELGASGADCENIVDFAREIEETVIAVFFRELNTGVKVSFRSKDDIDVGAVAAQFGGGGHVCASGCMAIGKLDEIKNHVKEMLLELL